jgi:hypothetical protein
MPDGNNIRNRVLLRLLGSPWVVAPFMAGMTALTAVWALGLRAGFALFAGLAGVLGALGAFVTQLVLRGETVARQVLDESDQNERDQARRALDDLDRILAEEDKDPRPETALRDLRALLAAYAEAEAGACAAQMAVLVEIRSRVNQLFNQCVQSLRQTTRLGQTARQLHSPAARQPLLDQREKIIADVQATVRQISDTLVGVQNLDSGDGSNRQLTRLREELDQSLLVARTVEERVNALIAEPSLSHSVPVLSSTSQTKG